jgi:hypothetical protein
MRMKDEIQIESEICAIVSVIAVCFIGVGAIIWLIIWSINR